MSVDNIVIRVVQSHEYEQVVQFIFDYFQSDEPLGSCEPIVVPNITNHTKLREYLKDGTSVMAVQVKEEGKEELVGVNIGVPRDRSYIETEKDATAQREKIPKFLNFAARQANVFQRYGVDRVFNFFMICVMPKLRGKKIATRLAEELVALAKNLGYKLLTVDCTSAYSKKIFTRMGWDIVKFIAYKDYKDENGQQVFNPPAPHEGLTILALHL